MVCMDKSQNLQLKLRGRFRSVSPQTFLRRFPMSAWTASVHRFSLHWARETDGCERVSHTFNAPAGRTDIREPTDFYQIAANFAELVNLRACNVLRTPRRNYLVHNDNNSDNGSVDTRVGTILIPGIMIPNSFGHFYGVN